MKVSLFAQILNRAIGLDGNSIGDGALTRALRFRMQVCGCSEEAYLSLLRNNSDELAELIEEVVVPETWFFRDLQPFKLLARDAVKSSSKCYSVLSAPCSTGEEPYSAAMALLAGGIDPSRIRVVGADISRRAIEKANKGIYGENSFRQNLPSYASCFFKAEAEGQKVSDAVRELVEFCCGNMIRGEVPQGPFDAVFCRNFMIYLDSQSREKLIEDLNFRLKPGGLLFVGHAEVMPLLDAYFDSVKSSGAFAFRKKTHAGTARAGFMPVAKSGSNEKVAALKLRKNHLQSRMTPSSPKAAKADSVGKSDVMVKNTVDSVKKNVVPANAEDASNGKEPCTADVRVLADQGRVREAMELCESLLEISGPDAEAFYLSGLLHETEGHSGAAEEYYRKALYMNPHHSEALAHMALMAEASGDRKKAAILRDRLERSAKGRGE